MDSQKIAQARRARGMTQEELAKALHVSRQTVSHWENGRITPGEETLKELYQVLEIAQEEPAEKKTAENPASAPAKKAPRPWLIAAAVLAAAAVILCVCLLTRPAAQPEYPLEWYRSQPETEADQPQLVFSGADSLPLIPYFGNEDDLRWDIRYTIREIHQQPLTLTGMTETFWNAAGEESIRNDFDADGVKNFLETDVLRSNAPINYNVYCSQQELSAYTVRIEGTDAEGRAMAFGWLVELSPEAELPLTAAELALLPSAEGACAVSPVENPAPLLSEGFGADGTESGWFYGINIQNVSETEAFTPMMLTEYYFINGRQVSSFDYGADELVAFGFPQTYQPGEAAPFIGGQMGTGNELTQVGYQLTYLDEAGAEHTVAALVDVERP